MFLILTKTSIKNLHNHVNFTLNKEVNGLEMQEPNHTVFSEVLFVLILLTILELPKSKKNPHL